MALHVYCIVHLLTVCTSRECDGPENRFIFWHANKAINQQRPSSNVSTTLYSVLAF
jgi:hypothetical protein